MDFLAEQAAKARAWDRSMGIRRQSGTRRPACMEILAEERKRGGLESTEGGSP